MKPTIRSIAEAAGVSRGTVDKVLNNRIGVSDDVRLAVQTIADAMGYRPNPAGKALAFQKNPIRIGLILLSGSDPIFKELRRGAESALKAYSDFGLQLIIETMDCITPEEQVRCIEKLEQNRISGLILSPLQDSLVQNALSRVTSANIPIVTTNTDLEESIRLCFVGQDLVRSGRVAGELMGKLLSTGGSIAIFSGSPSIKALHDRILGFETVLNEQYSHLTVCGTYENIETDESAYLRSLDLLNRIPGLKGFYITGKGISGVCRALRELGRSDIRIISYDIDDATVALLKDGWIDFTITQDPFQQGYQPVHILYDYFLLNRKPECDTFHTTLQIVTRENI